MKKLFKFVLTSSLLSISYLSAEYASVKQIDASDSCWNCCPQEVAYLCCPDTCYEIDLTALYLQPSCSNMHYAAEAIPLPLPSPDWVIADVDPDYHMGFELGVSANIFPRCTKLDLNWTHFHSKDTATKNVPSKDMVGPFFAIGPDSNAYFKSKGRVVFDYDSVNLDYGICLNFGDHFHTVLFTGVGGARIKQSLTSHYSNGDGTLSRIIKVPTSFLGAGPQLGLDLSYEICRGFQLAAGGTGTLLIGTSKNHTEYQSFSPVLSDPDVNITPPNTQSTKVSSRTQVVPALEGKLGLSYAFEFCNLFINLEAGYEARIYINAIQSVDMGSEVTLNPDAIRLQSVGVFARTFQRNMSNFALAGPYLTLNIGF